MSWAKLFSQPKAIATRVGQWQDPIVGPHLQKIQRPTVLARIHGEQLDALRTKNGFQPRIPQEEIATIRYSRVEEYQCTNADPFGWGACNSLKDLKPFIVDNRLHTDAKDIYIMFGKAASLTSLKQDVGMEGNGRDGEKEFIIIEHVPFEDIIASTGPKYREKFLSGDLVPNAMHEYDQDLPESMRISDLHTETEMLNWLLAHNAEMAFNKLCTTLYSKVSEETLKIRLHGDQNLIDAINSTLTASRPSLQF